MKHLARIRMLALASIVILTVNASAQSPATSDSQAVSEPDFADVFFGLDAAGKLVPLERQTAAIKGKASGFIVMSMKSSSEFPGEKSPVRFHAGDRLEFVVRSPLASSSVDPNTLYALRKLDRKKNKRELVIMAGRASPLGASTKTDLAQGVMSVNFSRYGNSSIKVNAGTLPPGEYALSHVYAQTVFCFGVD
jgi:hypothetical protein